MLSRPVLIESKREKKERAKRIYNTPCCKDNCLHVLGWKRAQPLLEECFEEVEERNGFDKHNYLFQKLLHATKGITASDRLDVDYNLGVGIHHKYYNVCRHCFMNVYGIKRTMLQSIKTQVHQGWLDSDAGNRDATTDGSSRVSLKNNPEFVRNMINWAKDRGIYLDPYQMASMAVPNTFGALTLFSWFDDYFSLVGHVEPNGHDIELEAQPLLEIYDEYVWQLTNAGMRDQIFSITHFETLWKECFPHVRRMTYTGLGGKCHTCAALGIARKTHTSRVARDHIKMLHEMHRSGYMNERRLYYGRRWKAQVYPTKFLSIITDGMAQAHCELPYYANVDQGECLTQHIQGVLCHGRFVNMYRTFHNTFTAANMQIHTLLLALEDAYRHKDGLPETVFIQIDGGPENVSKSMIAMCEMLVARKIVKRIILSRLMVGHTHEDIDGRFAKIWTRVRNAYVLTMNQYKSNIEAALGAEDLPCKVVDLFAIPDYDAFIRPVIDPNFGRYAKRRGEKDWSVLQFSFESVTDDKALPFFPLGVQTKWRPFAADKHIRIVRDENSECGMTVDELTPINWLPEAKSGQPEGMYLVSKYPDVPAILPEEFIQGSRADLELVTNKFVEQYNSDVGDEYAREWENFRDNVAPQNDSVEDWVKDHPLHVPFHDTLVRGDPVHVPMIEPNEALRDKARQGTRNRPRKSKPLDYLQWSRRGETKSKRDPSSKFPNIVVEGPPGIERYSIPVHCRASHDPGHKLSTAGLHLPPISHSKDVEVVPTQMTLAEAESEIMSATMEESDEDRKRSSEASTEDVSSHGDDSDASTDSDIEVNDWVTCRGPHHIPRYYCARDCVGNTFTVPDNMLTKASFGAKCPHGKVHSIVRKVGAQPNDVYFKIYNHLEHPDAPPPEDSEDFCYVPCTSFMSSDINRRMMCWDQSYRKPVQRKEREKKRTWAMEPARRALYDEASGDDSNSEVRHPRKLRSGRLIKSQEEDIVEEEEASGPILPSPVPVAPRRNYSRHSTAVSLPPIHIQRENIRKKLVSKGVLPGIQKASPDHVELSDLSSESESDSSSDEN